MCTWITFAIVFAAAAAGPGIDYQRLAENAVWEWHGERATLSYAMGAANAYQIEAIRPRMRTGHLNNVHVRFTDGDRVPFSDSTWSVWTVFVVDKDVLYYTDFNPMRPGCTIIAFDLKAGKQLWKSQLAGLGIVRVLRYMNRVALSVEKGALKVVGNELGGKYLEYVDLKTGKTLGHRIFEKK